MKLALITIFVLNLYVVFLTSCIVYHGNEYSDFNDSQNVIQVNLIDSETKKPIQDGLVFVLRANDSNLSASKEVELLHVHEIGNQGEFRYRIPKTSFRLYELWFLAPGYKSIPIHFTKDWVPLLHLPGKDPVLGLLLTMIGDTKIKTDLENGITTIPLQSLRENPELWEQEITIGLYPLKSVAPSEELSRFIANERKAIHEKSTATHGQQLRRPANCETSKMCNSLQWSFACSAAAAEAIR